jgi:hypothetical protein
MVKRAAAAAAAEAAAPPAEHVYERLIFSFDEELERQRRVLAHAAPVYHFGRGGAGNHAPATAGAGTSAPRADASGCSAGLQDGWSHWRETVAK